MTPTLQKKVPYLLILLGLFLLFFMSQAIPAGICFLIGIVWLLERRWPEEWGKDNGN